MPIDLPDDIELELVASSDDVDLRNGHQSRAMPDGGPIELTFPGELWYWRGPAPYHFISVPADGVLAIRAIARDVTYGWGMIPAEVTIGGSTWKTALWPKDGAYVVPIKDRYREAERLGLGVVVGVQVVIRR